jgi:hypothetical protein
MHGGGGQSEQGRDAGRSQRRSTRSLMIRRSVRVGVRRGLWVGAAGSVGHAILALAAVAACQRAAVVTETWNRSAAQWPSVLDDAAGQAQPSGGSQGGVTVELSVTLSGPPMRW